MSELFTPDEWAPPSFERHPHDHKGYSEERCVRCGWVMGMTALNCMNDDTPHVFPSQQEPELVMFQSDIPDPFPDVDNPWNEIVRLREQAEYLHDNVAMLRNEVAEWEFAVRQWQEKAEEARHLRAVLDAIDALLQEVKSGDRVHLPIVLNEIENLLIHPTASSSQPNLHDRPEKANDE